MSEATSQEDDQSTERARLIGKPGAAVDCLEAILSNSASLGRWTKMRAGCLESWPHPKPRRSGASEPALVAQWRIARGIARQLDACHGVCATVSL